MSSIEKISEGDEFLHSYECTTEKVELFGELSGDKNSLHVNEDFACRHGFLGKVVYGNVLGLMVSNLVGMRLGCEDVLLLSQNMKYRKPVYHGDTIDLKGVVTAVSDAVGVIELKLVFTNQRDENVATGKCQVKVLS